MFCFQVPKGKPMTKWAQFAKDRGIRKTKKDKLVWDEASKVYFIFQFFNTALHNYLCVLVIKALCNIRIFSPF